MPILLNTLFNENEPVLCRPAEAIDCLPCTCMDALVLGSMVVERSGAQEPAAYAERTSRLAAVGD